MNHKRRTQQKDPKTYAIGTISKPTEPEYLKYDQHVIEKKRKQQRLEFILFFVLLTIFPQGHHYENRNNKTKKLLEACVCLFV